MKAYMGNRRVAPLILNVGVDDQATAALFPERTPVYTEQEAGWAPEPVYIFWTKKKKIPPLLGFEPRIVHSTAYPLYGLRYPGSRTNYVAMA
jgi:hypothetical protein